MTWPQLRSPFNVLNQILRQQLRCINTVTRLLCTLDPYVQLIKHVKKKSYGDIPQPAKKICESAVMQRHCRPNHMFLLLLFFQRQILTGHGHVKVKNNPPKTLGVSLGEMSGEERVRIQLSASSRDNSIISDHIWIFTTFLKINWRMSRYYYPGYKRFFSRVRMDALVSATGRQIFGRRPE